MNSTHNARCDWCGKSVRTRSKGMVYCDECREWIHQMRRQKDTPDILDQRHKQNNWCILFCPGGEYNIGAKFSRMEIRLGVPQMAFPSGTVFENEKNGKRLTVDRTGLAVV